MTYLLAPVLEGMKKSHLRDLATGYVHEAVMADRDESMMRLSETGQVASSSTVKNRVYLKARDLARKGVLRNGRTRSVTGPDTRAEEFDAVCRHMSVLVHHVSVR